MKLKQVSPGTYHTLDEHWSIERQIVTETECECPESLCRHGGETMPIWGWIIWDLFRDDHAYVLGLPVVDYYPTLRDAKHALIRALEVT